MTNAHRPTFKSAAGEGSNAKIAVPSRNYSARDLPG